MGYFNGKDKDFDFAKAYGFWDFLAYRGCDARVWAFFNRYCSGMDKYLPYLDGKEDAEIMPLYVKPDKKVSVRDMQNMMRDHFEGTPFDMTKDAGAKIFWDSPYRFRPMNFDVEGKTYFNERAIATQQTAFVLVSQMRSWLPNEIGGIHWFGVDDAATQGNAMYTADQQLRNIFSMNSSDSNHRNVDIGLTHPIQQIAITFQPENRCKILFGRGKTKRTATEIIGSGITQDR
jgi:dipeptidase